jgi:Uma2 family endonuclease
MLNTMAAREPERMTYAEYLALEQRSDRKYEWLEGRAYAMAGGTPEHALLSMAIGAELRAALIGKPSRVYSSDLKVRALETGLATYPDAAVVCGEVERHPEDRNAVTNPRLVVEVLSDATEACDRGEKSQHYRRIASLRELVFVSQREPRLEVWRRSERGTWEVFEAGAGESVELETTGAKLEVDRVYAGAFDPPS